MQIVAVVAAKYCCRKQIFYILTIFGTPYGMFMTFFTILLFLYFMILTYAISPSSQKIAEKLVILNERTTGIITRIYNIKKTVVQSITAIKQDIIKALSLYYNTFVDLMDLKDHITELLTIIDACQLHLNIVLLGAINSLAAVYVRRNLTADKWRAGQILSLVTASNQLLAVAQTDTMPCEYLSLETMNRWIICKIANRYNKRVAELKEFVATAVQHSVLPEMLFYMVELRELLLRYRSVVQRYHVQYLAGFDALALNELLQSIASIPQESSVIFSDFCQAIAELNVEDLENDSVAYNFQGLRLDWYRLQRIHIEEKGLSLCNLFLDEIAKETRNVVSTAYEQHRLLSEELLPKTCAKLIANAINKENRKKSNFMTLEKKSFKRSLSPQHGYPGDESYRRSREDMTLIDKLHFALTELCFAIDYYPQIVVWEHTFAPREYLTQHIEARFNKTVVAMAMYDKDTQEIAKPSELLNSIRTYMDVLQTLENYVQIDVVRIFNNVLLQQTQHQDCYGEETYLEVLLRRVSNYQILYSGHLRTFVSNPMSEVATSFFPEEYTDYPELCALAEILGAYGMKFLSERLMWHVAGQISELKKLVLQNRESLRAMRTNFDRPDRMRELFRHLTVTDGNKKHLDAVDNLLQRVTIVGEIVCFRDLLRQGLNELVSERVPFLVNCMEDFKRTTCSGDKLDMLPVSEMFSAAGIKCIVDSDLVNALRAQKTDDAVDDDYNVCCLLMVFIAVSLTRLARSENFYHATLETHLNNSHCIPKAVNAIATALFSIHRREDIVDRMKEFLALASSCLLQMDEETDRDTLKNKDTAYIILEQIVEESPFLTNDILESCFPYILIRCAYRSCYQQAFVNSINNSN
ncbi:Nck-associated protein 1 [Trichinella nelsoni]|uniref:Nck-associated protein 1 n=1 Tax=Trichinella nelsoni TaxID=6336 RepID=A0A0V0RNS7_9BILA|nr:Nck-associated protein 1 [Trichinella nelsoni]